MTQKAQLTTFHKNFGLVVDRLELWAVNPWRRYSLLLIVLLSGFVIGSSIGMINGVLALMDPIGALIVVLLLVLMIRLRRHWPLKDGARISLELIDVGRIGLLYGLLMEGFKLL